MKLKLFFTGLTLVATAFLFTFCDKANATNTDNTMITENRTLGTTIFASKYPFQETLAKLRETLTKENIAVFTEVDHAAAAKKVGLELRPTLVLIVGNPKAGTALMQENQAIAIELPLKILVLENEKGETMVIYQQIAPIGKSYNLTKTKKRTEDIDAKMISIIKEAVL